MLAARRLLLIRQDVMASLLPELATGIERVLPPQTDSSNTTGLSCSTSRSKDIEDTRYATKTGVSKGIPVLPWSVHALSYACLILKLAINGFITDTIRTNWRPKEPVTTLSRAFLGGNGWGLRSVGGERMMGSVKKNGVNLSFQPHGSESHSSKV
ncbi:hypothetical protein Tco_0585775 [Tanacetum coccineum]